MHSRADLERKASGRTTASSHPRRTTRVSSQLGVRTLPGGPDATEPTRSQSAEASAVVRGVVRGSVSTDRRDPGVPPRADLERNRAVAGDTGDPLVDTRLDRAPPRPASVPRAPPPTTRCEEGAANGEQRCSQSEQDADVSTAGDRQAQPSREGSRPLQQLCIIRRRTRRTRRQRRRRRRRRRRRGGGCLGRGVCVDHPQVRGRAGFDDHRIRHRGADLEAAGRARWRARPPSTSSLRRAHRTTTRPRRWLGRRR